MALPEKTHAVIEDFEGSRKTFEGPLLLNEEEWERLMEYLKSGKEAPKNLKELMKLPDFNESYLEGKERAYW